MCCSRTATGLLRNAQRGLDSRCSSTTTPTSRRMMMESLSFFVSFLIAFLSVRMTTLILSNVMMSSSRVSRACEQQHQQQQQRQLDHTTTALLLMDPHSNRFELIQLQLFSSNDTTAEILAQIPHTATLDYFRTQLHYKDVWGTSDIRVAVPYSGMSSTRACLQKAVGILTTDPIHSMVRSCR